MKVFRLLLVILVLAVCVNSFLDESGVDELIQKFEEVMNDLQNREDFQNLLKMSEEDEEGRQFYQEFLNRSSNETLFPDPKSNITQYLTDLGYPVQTHEILTDDGYVLTYFRVQAKNSKILNGLPAVYWQHGLLDSSDLTVLNSEDKAPALVLANAGFDVWLGNSRGNWHSKKNIYYETSQRQFWQFTWQDMAMKDLPAAFTYIKNVTQQKTINYIGHSQGTMIMHAALALGIKPVIDNVGKIISTGPVAYIGHMNTVLITELFKRLDFYRPLDLLKYWDFLPAGQKTFELETKLCTAYPWACALVLRLIMDLMPYIDNLERLVYYVNHVPCGTSLKNIHHFQQLYLSNKFQLYDYGEKGNLANYNQTTPPQIDLTKIKKNVHLFAGDTDELADPVDVVRLYNEMINSEGRTIDMYHSGHSSFLIGKDMKYLQKVIQILNE